MKNKEIQRSQRFIVYHQLKAIVECLKEFMNNGSNLDLTENMFLMIKKVHDDFISTIRGDALSGLPKIHRNMSVYEVMLLTNIYLFTAESFLSEEERHILLKTLEVAERVKNIIK